MNLLACTWMFSDEPLATRVHGNVYTWVFSDEARAVACTWMFSDEPLAHVYTWVFSDEPRTHDNFVNSSMNILPEVTTRERTIQR